MLLLKGMSCVRVKPACNALHGVVMLQVWGGTAGDRHEERRVLV